MALVIKDRVKVLATTTGTGIFTLGATVDGFQSFSVIGDGNTTYYTIVAQSTPDWEVGIGTYTASGTLLSRDTILESSNGGAAVDFPAGTKDVFVTYPAERAIYLDTAGSYPVQNTFNTLNAANAVLTAGTISTTPVNATDLVNKTYVDTIASSGVHFHTPVRVETPSSEGALNATYNNGSSGVGATLTNAGTQAALVIDGVTLTTADRVLVYNQTNAVQNGVYVVTDTGSVSTNWVLTRSDDTDSYGVDSPNSLSEGSTFYIADGNTGKGETYTCNTPGVITFGTTNITFAQISAAQIYSAGTGLTLTNTTFSITNTGTAGTYGSASSVPVLTTNAQGQVTSVVDTAIAINSGAVSGLAASATTDTTSASNITSGTLDIGRLAGSYTGITGVGTLTAGTWNASTIQPAYGGTGVTTYTIGDLLYASNTNVLTKLSDVEVGNALISGGVATAPSWGKIGLATHVSGTLPVANGGTNSASIPTAGGISYGDGSGYAFTAAGTTGQVLVSNGSGAPSWTTLSTGGVESFNTRTGAVTLSSGDVTDALGYTPYNSSNPSGYITGINSSMVTTALGYTPYNSSNPSGYITSSGSISGNAATATNATTAGRIDSSVRNYSREWIEFPNYSGLYSPNNGAHFKPNDASYGAWRSEGARNGWGGIEIKHGNDGGASSLMWNANVYGFHYNGVGWRFYNESGNGYFPGNVVAYWSDRRLKENFRPIGRESLEILSHFTTFRFNWNNKVKDMGLPIEPGKEEIGLVAQDVQARLPDAVQVNKTANKVNPDGSQTESDYLTINWDKITPILVGAVNVHDADITELRAEIAALRTLLVTKGLL